MTIEIPFDVDSPVIHASPQGIFRSGKIVSIEAEIFIKVQDDETQEILTYKPDQIYTPRQAREYLDSISVRVQTLEQAVAKQGG